VSPSSFIFTAVQDGSNPPPASLNVSNTGAGSLSFTASADASAGWLSVSPTSGTAPPAQTLQVSAAVGSLAALISTSRRQGMDLIPIHGGGVLYAFDLSGAPVLAGWFKVVPSIAMPNGGGGIWGYGGVAVDSLGRVIAATGADSKPYTPTVPEGYSPYAGRMVALATDLGYSSSNLLGSPLGSYEPPHPSPCPGAPGVCDMDFGATPIVFQPPGCPKPLTAAMNKDGHIYVLPVDDLAASAATSLQGLALNNAYDGPGAGGLTGGARLLAYRQHAVHD
jgi:hypothetical protein